MGCPGDWDPACTQSELSRVGDTDIYQGTFEVPEGDFAFKVALNGSWDLNYGTNGAENGPNIGFDHAGGPIAFRYDHTTHLVTIVSG